MRIDIEKITIFLQNIPVADNYNWEIPLSKGKGSNIFLVEDINSFKDQDTALRAIVNINAGLGNDINGSDHLRSATKALIRSKEFLSLLEFLINRK